MIRLIHDRPSPHDILLGNCRLEGPLLYALSLVIHRGPPQFSELRPTLLFDRIEHPCVTAGTNEL